MRAPRLPMLLCAAVLGLALLWRLPATEGEWGFVLCENDSLFHLHRVQGCLERFPLVPSVDPYSHYPNGYRIHWINAHSLFYAALARLAGLDGNDPARLGAVLSWVPPLFGVLGAWLVMGAAASLADNRWAGVVAGLLYALNAEAVRPFFFGTIDHHLFAHLGVLLLVLGRSRDRLWMWVAGLAALFAMTPEAALYASVLLVAALAADAAGADRGAAAGWYLAPAVVCALAWVTHRSLETAPLPWLDLRWMYFSLFHVLWFAVLGAGCLAVARAATRPDHSGRTAVAVGWRLAAGGAACLALLGLSGNLSTILTRLAVAGRIFVAEEDFVFANGFWNAPAWYRLLAACAAVLPLRFYQCARRRADAGEWFRWLALTAALGLGLKEFRHLYVLSGLHVLAVVAAVMALERYGRNLPALARPRAARWIPAGALALAVAAIVYPDDVADRAATRGDACARSAIGRQLADWLRANTPPAGTAGEEDPSYGVFAPWSIGHHIHVLGRRPVVVDPLNYETEAGVEAALEEAWLSRGAGELLRALERRGVRYLVLTNPAEEIAGVLRRRGLPKDEFVEFRPDGTFTLKPAMAAFAVFRLFMGIGQPGEFDALERRFVTAEAETLVARSAEGGIREVAIPKGQIYELRALRTI